MKVLLDTSFILTCLKEKKDFLQAGEFGQLILPVEVIGELRRLLRKGKGKEKERAFLALKIIEANKSIFDEVELGKKHVDSGIKDYIRGRKVIVATLDKGLKKNLKGKAKILTIRSKKKLVLI